MNIFSNTICDHNGDSDDDDDVMNDVPQMNCELTVAAGSAGGCVCVCYVSPPVIVPCSELRSRHMHILNLLIFFYWPF